MTFKQYRVPLPFHERYFSQMNMCIIFSVILMPKTEKHLCRHRITKFATSVFCFMSNRTKVYLQKTRNQKRNDEFNLNVFSNWLHVQVSDHSSNLNVVIKSTSKRSVPWKLECKPQQVTPTIDHGYSRLVPE